MRFRVAALITNLGWPPGAIILNPEDYARAWGSTDPSAYNVVLASGSLARQRGVMRSSGALGAGSGLVVQTARQRECVHAGGQPSGAWPSHADRDCSC